MPEDADLLRHYVRDRAEAAFAELVRRHIDGVYSAALRRVGGDTHLAEDVTQQVFVALARKAATLSRHPVLTGWLYLTTRNEAANLVRSEQRRKIREQEAQAMHEIFSEQSSTVDWSRIAPLLDGAIDQLNSSDRAVVLLRFVDRRGFAEIGALLRITEDAARMRHERALEKLRASLARRGLTSTSAALSLALASNVATAAPAALAATVTSVATASLAIAPPVLGLIPFMSTTKLSVVIVGLALIAGAVAITRQAAPKSIEAVHGSSPAPRSGQDITPEAAKLSVNPTVPIVAASPSTRPSLVAPELTETEVKIAALKDILAHSPTQSIPELQLATEGDWYGAVEGKLETPEDYRRSLGKLRSSAERRFAELAQPALRAFLKANGGQFPKEATEIQPFLSDDLDHAILRRYRIVPASEIPNVKVGGNWAITQSALVDQEYDWTTVIGASGFGSTSVPPTLARDVALLGPVWKAYQNAHLGEPADLDGPNAVLKLLPFASTAEQQGAVQREAERRAKESAKMGK